MNRKYLLPPLLAGFFVMGFGDIIGTVMNQVKAECAENADAISWLMPIFAYVWFLVISIPTGVVAGRIGRKNTVLLSLAVTVAAMAVAFSAGAERWYLYIAAFALVGIGNTIIQAALPALMSNVVEPSQLASRISLGQFVKALCAALTPVFVYLTATLLGNWKLLFPLYGALTVVAALWLWFAEVPDERAAGAGAQPVSKTSFGGCFAMLKEPYVAAMTAGILFSVGADVGFSVAIPEYLKNVFKGLVPGVGELIGGSQREERLDVLTARIAECGMKEEDYGYYLDTRRFGTNPHAGFGLGFERLVMYLTGMSNIRDVLPFPRTTGSAEY